jgi:hypothetical protein
MSVIPFSRGEQMLALATTPAETKQVESMASAAHAWAKEQGDYETMVKAIHLYMMARRKTTQLILPDLSKIAQGNKLVTLTQDYGFTKMQWHRRVKELEIPDHDLEAYFDDCIARHWEPSIFGLLKHQNKQTFTVKQIEKCPACGRPM